jgi:histidyl-tRNA synthetase
VVAYQWVSKLVASGIRAELYPDASKLKKQFDFADKKGIGFLALVGTNEMASNAIPVKNLATGEQTTLDFEGILAAVKGH